MHNVVLALAAFVTAIAAFVGLSYVFDDAKRSRTGFIIFGCVIAVVLLLMIGVDNTPKTDHISRYGLFSPRD
jgi:hypothetical protein